ncbi:MAG TPA: thioredoxin domain-containing protein [Polyangiaceae bacterium]
MVARLSLTALRVAALSGLAVSSALYADYTSYSPSFCGSGTGCDAVRRSGFGYVVLPVGESGTALPVPLFGVVGFALLLGASLLSKPRVRRLLTTLLAYGGGAIGVMLLGIQAFQIGQFCSLCVAADASAVVAASAVLSLGMKGWADLEASPEWLPAWAWSVLGALLFVVPLVWPSYRPQAPVPAAIAAYYRPGKINVVEFADFECPFCRALHHRLGPLLSEYGDRVHFERLNMPLERHLYARDAARAAVCAKYQGHEPEMADHLFEADDLRANALERAAADLGLDVAAYQRCIDDPKTDAAIDEQARVLLEAGFEGLPTTYIGAERLVGAVPNEVLRDALERAQASGAARGVSALSFFGAAGLVGFLVIALGRWSVSPRRRAASRPAAT